MVDLRVTWVQNGASFLKDPNGVAPVHFSSKKTLGNEFETTPSVYGYFIDYDPGREDQNSMLGYRDAEFEKTLISFFHVHPPRTN